MYSSIVVPLDGSAVGNHALPVAVALALRSDAAVHLVHVHEAIVLPDGGSMYDTRLFSDQREEMRSDLTALAARLTREASLWVDAEFLDGPVAPTLQRYLADRRHGLVVMMTHGRGGLSRAWLGSVADALVRHAPVPLLLMREGSESLSDPVEPLFRRVLIPLDGSPTAEEVLDHVVSLATPEATVYALLTIVVPILTLEYPSADTEAVSRRPDVQRQRDAGLEYLAGVATVLRETGARVEARVKVHDRPAQGILDSADEQQVDLIALSTHGHGGLSRLFQGSVADKVVRGATVPVLVFRPESVRAQSAERGSDGAAESMGDAA